MSAHRFEPRIESSSSGHHVYIVSIHPSGEEHVVRGFASRTLATRKSAEKSAHDYIAKHLTPRGEVVPHFAQVPGHVASGQDASFDVGTVVHFRGRARRYVVVRIEPSYSGGAGRHSLKALSGGPKGSGPTGVKGSEIARDADQSHEVSGASARWLKSHLGHPASWGARPPGMVSGQWGPRHTLKDLEAKAADRRSSKGEWPQSKQAEWLAQFGIKE